PTLDGSTVYAVVNDTIVAIDLAHDTTRDLAHNALATTTIATTTTTIAATTTTTIATTEHALYYQGTDFALHAIDPRIGTPLWDWFVDSHVDLIAAGPFLYTYTLDPEHITAFAPDPIGRRPEHAVILGSVDLCGSSGDTHAITVAGQTIRIRRDGTFDARVHGRGTLGLWLDGGLSWRAHATIPLDESRTYELRCIPVAECAQARR
ncbi:MAG: hypothetical protein KF773_23145, partial [Deltaproteobacteria bacterium]|nr:hypothetical protein [Deltaproteobacteria bacterium]